jgi:hypothetical protein
MFSTTLRISDDLAGFLQQAAKADALSVNAYLAGLLERERLAARRQKLARDWAAYAAEEGAQDVDYALAAQAQVAAEATYPYHEESRPTPDRKRKRK